MLSNHERRKYLSLLCLGGFISSLELFGVWLLFRTLKDFGNNTTIDSGDSLGIVAGLSVFLIRGLLALFMSSQTLRLLTAAEARTATDLARVYMHDWIRNPDSVTTNVQLRMFDRTVNEVFTKVLIDFFSLVVEVVLVAVITVALLVYAPTAALAAFLYLSIAVVVYLKFVSSRARLNGKSLQERSSDSLRVFTETTRLARQHFLNDEIPLALRSIAIAREKLIGPRRFEKLMALVPRYYLETVLIVGVAVVAGSSKVLGDGAGIGIVGLFLFGGFRLLPSMYRISVAITGLQSGTFAVSVVEEDLQRMPPRDLEVVRSHSSSIAGPYSVVLDSVTVRYKSGKTACRDVTLRIEPGQLCYLAGPSGSGKSTVMNAIAGFLEVTEGCVSIAGRGGRADSSSQRLAIGYVPQEIFLANSSVLENVYLGCPKYLQDEQRAFAAIRAAGLDAWINELPDGLKTQVGDNGSMLSGGQRQRLGIARALYRNPGLLLLDEATSNLDSESEALVLSTIQSLKGTVTILFVTHRPIDLKPGEQLFSLKDGVLLSGH